jgi:chromosome segregation ATPase
MESQVVTTEIARTYQTLYNYKVVDKLIELGFLKLSEKKGKSSYYKWNFDTKVDLELSDALYINVLLYRRNLTRKYAENKIIQNNKKELIESQQDMELKQEFCDNCGNDVCCCIEITQEKEELPPYFNFLSPDEQARLLGLVPTKEEIQAWKDEIEYLKDKLKNKIEALTRQQTANKSYKKRIFETEENLNQSLKIIKAQDNKIQGYENSLNSEKVSVESYKKRFEDAQKSLDEAKKVINEQEIAIEFFKQKKPFKSIKPKIEPKQVKYFKLFGYTIYEKN